MAVNANKAMIFSTSGFQSGALKFAKDKGIATIIFNNGHSLYKTNSKNKEQESIPNWVPKFVGLFFKTIDNNGKSKYARIMMDLPFVDYIIRGEAEVALPRLLWALSGKEELCDVENLVIRDSGKIVVNKPDYINLDEYPSPKLSGCHPIIPYESMRGCPFRCKFCSYPSASPKWRYKSAKKICYDWKMYAEENGTKIIRAKDSTFSVSHQRFNELLEQLPKIGVSWEAYIRSDEIKNSSFVHRLKDAYCRYLSIGFESMSDKILTHINKQIKAIHNRRALEALDNKNLYYHISFMVDYPGETPEDYQTTHDFIVQQFAGRFMIHPFSASDETMPL